MGLGGVAIAVPPYVIHPKTAVLGRAGGGYSLESKSILLLKAAVYSSILIESIHVSFLSVPQNI